MPSLQSSACAQQWATWLRAGVRVQGYLPDAGWFKSCRGGGLWAAAATTKSSKQAELESSSGCMGPPWPAVQYLQSPGDSRQGLEVSQVMPAQGSAGSNTGWGQMPGLCTPHAAERCKEGQETQGRLLARRGDAVNGQQGKLGAQGAATAAMCNTPLERTCGLHVPRPGATGRQSELPSTRSAPCWQCSAPSTPCTCLHSKATR